MAWLLVFLICYFAGSIPFGLILCWWVRGIDIRQHGSKNIGATNVGRVIGHKWFWVVFAFDALKGALPTLLVPMLFRDWFAPEQMNHVAVFAGLATILGHMFPCWLKFAGGKGVATGLGATLVFAPQAGLVALVAFLVTYGIWRVVSLGSLVASAAFMIAEIIILLPNPFSAENWSVAAISIVVPILIIVRHKSNIVRLLNSRELSTKSGEKPSEKTKTP
jgi:acyl-phosphate glycerol 3-phosphate acyltransferase